MQPHNKQTAIIIVVRPRCAYAPQHCYSKHGIKIQHCFSKHTAHTSHTYKYYHIIDNITQKTQKKSNAQESDL